MDDDDDDDADDEYDDDRWKRCGVAAGRSGRYQRVLGLGHP